MKVIGKEFRHATFLEKIPGYREDDVHLVKEILHRKNGEKIPNYRVVKNFMRDFYITKPPYQNYKQKKDSEPFERLNKFQSTDSDLAKSVASRLGKIVGPKITLRDISDSPYIYGTGVTAASIMKYKYKQAFPKAISPQRYCVGDIEIFIEGQDVTVFTIAMNDKIYTAINWKLVENLKLTKEQIITNLYKLYKDNIPESKIRESIKTIEYEIFDNEALLIKKVFDKADDWMPDKMAFWNINFDVPHILKRLAKYGIDPKSVFCDYRLPENYKVFKYVEGPKKRLTEAGKEMSINFQEQWHFARCSASYELIDAMLVYSQVRAGQKAVPGGYGLDNIMKKHLKMGKLKFTYLEEVNKLSGADWHNEMSSKHPLEYIIYNQWDNMGMLELDNSTGDIQNVLDLLAGVSEMGSIPSGPKKITDAMHFFCLERGMVLGQKAKTIDKEELLNRKNWINVQVITNLLTVPVLSD